jgi:hypothetical protein
MEKQQIIFAIDPGNTQSGFARLEMPSFKLCEFGKIDNEKLLGMLENYEPNAPDVFAIEMVASYGMAVGKDVFETCVWIGQFVHAIKGRQYDFIYRKEEKIALCGSMKAKDSNIRQALIDRYAQFDFKNGKGTKKEPDTFYGVSKDVWQAIAVGVTYFEKLKEGAE